MRELTFHPLADLFPLMEGEDFERLADDIAANGLDSDIALLDGKILDGRNRYRALVARGIFRESFLTHMDDELASEHSALAWVLSKNLHRRHLSASQRGILAARLADMKAGRPVKNEADGGAEEPKTAPIGAISKKHAADLLNVGQGSVDRGKKVLADGADELVEAVQKGDVSLGAAAEIATLPMEEQVEAIASADPKAFAKVARVRRDEKTAAKKQRRTEREAELGRHQLSLPDKKFGVIYADPEWKFKPYSEKTGMDRAADNHYPTSNAQDILERRVQDISAPDAVLFLWATVPMIEDALDVMGGWNFSYRSHFVWVKDRAGTGYWNRNQHEILLVGTRGHVPCPAPGTQWPSVITAPVGRHSQKPEIFYFLIESYFPSLPKIELNARHVRDGWCAWGNEIILDIAETVNLGVVTEGFADASHLPLPPNPHALAAPHPGPPRKGEGEDEAVSSASPAPQSKKKPEKAKPLCVKIESGGLHLIARFSEVKITFYATQKAPSFPAEIGWVEAEWAGGSEIEPESARPLAQKIWAENFSQSDDLFIPTTIYKMGRTGPVPISGGGAGEGPTRADGGNGKDAGESG